MKVATAGLSRWLLAAFSTSAACWTSTVWALDPQECSDLHLATQMTRAEARLTQAAEAAHQCGNDSCPELIRHECRTWSAELEAAIPQLNLVVQDEEGKAVLAPRVEIDNKLLASSREHELRLNPGRHTVHISAAGFQEWEREVELSEGKVLRLAVDLQKVPEPANPRRTAGWVFLGVGAASGIAAVILGVNARRLETNLENCSPDCSEGAVSRVQTQYILTNVAWGLGLASGGAGVVLWWTSRDANQATALGVGLTGASASLNWRGAF